MNKIPFNDTDVQEYDEDDPYFYNDYDSAYEDSEGNEII